MKIDPSTIKVKGEEPKIAINLSTIKEVEKPDSSILGATGSALKEGIVGTAETLLNVTSAIPSTVAGQIRALPKTFIPDEYGNTMSVREAQEFAGKSAEATTYQPMTEGGKRGSEMVGKFFKAVFDPIIQTGGQMIGGSKLGDLSQALTGTRAPVEFTGEVVAGLAPLDFMLARPITPVGAILKRPVNKVVAKRRGQAIEEAKASEIKAETFVEKKQAVEKTIAQERLTEKLSQPGAEIKLEVIPGTIQAKTVPGEAAPKPEQKSLLELANELHKEAQDKVEAQKAVEVEIGRLDDAEAAEAIRQAKREAEQGVVEAEPNVKISQKGEVAEPTIEAPTPTQPLKPIEPPALGDRVYYKGQYREVEGISGELVSLENIRDTVPITKLAKASPEEHFLLRSGFKDSEVQSMTPEQRLSTAKEILDHITQTIKPEDIEVMKGVQAKITAALRDKDVMTLKESGIAEDRIASLDDRKIRQLAREIREKGKTALSKNEELQNLTKAKQTLEQAQEVIDKSGDLPDEYASQIADDMIRIQENFDPEVYDPIADLISYIPENVDKAAIAEAVKKGDEIRGRIMLPEDIKSRLLDRNKTIKKEEKLTKAQEKREAAKQQKEIKVERVPEYTEDMYKQETEIAPTVRKSKKERTSLEDDWEAKLAQEGLGDEPRDVFDFMDDVSTVIGGSEELNVFGAGIAYEGLYNRLLKGKDLNPRQMAARERLLRDMDDFKAEADRLKMGVAEYLFMKKYPLDVLVPFKGLFDDRTIIEIPDVNSNWKVISKADSEGNITSSYSVWDTMKLDEPVRLEDAYYHPLLYEIYPELRSAILIKDTSIPYGEGHMFTRKDGKYQIHLSAMSDGKLARITLTHEVDHTLSRIEGTPTGGNVNLESTLDSIKQLENRYKRKGQNDKLDKLYVLKNYEAEIRKLLHKEETLPKSSAGYKLAHEDLRMFRSHFRDLMFDAYQAKAGEVEARIASGRADIPEEELFKTPIKWGGYRKDEVTLNYKGNGYSILGPVYDNIRQRIKDGKIMANSPGVRIVDVVMRGNLDPGYIIKPNGQPNDPRTMGAALWRMTTSWAKGTPAEGLIIRAIKGQMKESYDHYVNTVGLRKIQMDLKANGGDPLVIGDVIRGKKTTHNAAELKAVQEVRSYLDYMRVKYKDFLRAEFKRSPGMTPKRIQAIDETLASKDPLATLKYWAAKGEDPRVIADLAMKLKDIDNWGLDDYITNVELGTYKLLNDKGNVVAVALSERDAVNKATTYFMEHPDSNTLTIDTGFSDRAQSLTELKSGKQYWAIVNNLKKAIKKEAGIVENKVAEHMAREAMKGTFTIKPADIYSPFVEQRRNVLKGEEDIFPVLYKYSRIMERKMNLDPVMEEARALIPELTKEGYINLPKLVSELMDDIKGKQGRAESFVDDMLINSTEKAQRFLEGVGLNVDLPVPAPYILSRNLQRGRKGLSNLMLGYRPVNGIINYISGQSHVGIKVGEPIYLKAKSYMNTSEGQALLREVEPYLGQNFIEEVSGRLSPWKAETTAGKVLEAVKPLSFFQMAELPNREIGIVANYLYAKEKLGMAHPEAREYAIQGNWAQNFIYNVAALPSAFRGPIGRTILQFKPYLIQELAYIRSLSPVQLLRYSGMMVALGGPKAAVTLAKSLPFLAVVPGFASMMDEVEREMSDKYPMLFRGIPGALGVDVSAMSVFQFPESWQDWSGVMLSTIWQGYKNVIKPFAEGKVLDSYDLSKAIGDLAPFFKHWRAIWQTAVSKDGWVRDEKGYKLYQVYDPKQTTTEMFANIGAHTVKRALGATPLVQSREQTEQRTINAQTERENWNKVRAARAYLDVIKEGKEVPDEVISAVRDVGAENLIVEMAKQWNLTPKQRRVMRASLRKREEVSAFEEMPIMFAPEAFTTISPSEMVE